jgi:hypothetical protein
MKIKGPFMKVVSLNETIKHPLFKPNFDIAQLSMINMPLKWHHIDKCNKNCRKNDVLISILACLSSSAP